MERQEFKENLLKCFDWGEIKSLCFDLSILFDEIPGDRISNKIEGLLIACYYSEKLSELHRSLLNLRPKVKWPSLETIKSYDWESFALSTGFLISIGDLNKVLAEKSNQITINQTIIKSSPVKPNIEVEDGPHLFRKVLINWIIYQKKKIFFTVIATLSLLISLAIYYSYSQSKSEELSNHGIRLLESKDFENAEKIFLSAINWSDRNAEAHFGLAEVSRSRNNKPSSEIINHYDQAILYDNLNDHYHHRFGNYMVLQGGDFEKAESLLLKAIELNNENPFSYNDLAYLLIELDNPEWNQAKVYLEEALALNQSSPAIFTNLGRVYINDQNYEEAIQMLSISVDLELDQDGSSPNPWYYLAYAYELNGQIELACKTLSEFGLMHTPQIRFQEKFNELKCSIN